MAKLRHDLFTLMDAEGLGPFADELLRCGLVSAMQLYEVAGREPPPNARLLLLPASVRLGQLAGGAGGGNEPPALRRRALCWKA